MVLYKMLYTQYNIVNYAQNSTFPSKLLVLFLALGFLLIIILTVIVVYIILKLSSTRKDEVQADTRIKSREMATEKSPESTLPKGTALQDGVYEVEVHLDSTDNYDVYRIKRTQPQYLCSHCNAELDNDTNAFCRVCGAELGVIPPTYGTYLLKESKNAEMFSTTERLIGMSLNHPSLILPLEYFTDSPMDIPRYYLVEPFEQEPRLSASQFPLPVNIALDIGVSLAEGLAYLHNYNVLLNHLDLDSVVYNSDQARWLTYANVHLLSTDEQGNYDSMFADNVRDLTALLQQVLLGNASSSTTTIVPDEIQELLLHYSDPEENNTADKLARSLRQANRMLGGHNQVQYQLGAKSDVGRLRKLNEDSMILRELSSLFQDLGVTIVIGGVADGVGGHAAGDVASQAAVASLQIHLEELQEYAREGRIPDAGEWIIKAAIDANERVYTERNEAGNNMACTLVLAFFTGDLATILNVGDSRAYLLNERGIRQITTDHSLVERLVSIGEITREEARHHPRKSVIYRVIGDRLHLDYDIFSQTFVPGEALLMCSDGLTDMVDDVTIWRIWRAASSPQEAAEQLVAEANTSGGTDNITVVIIKVAKSM